jgi:hypothetical protein
MGRRDAQQVALRMAWCAPSLGAWPGRRRDFGLDDGPTRCSRPEVLCLVNLAALVSWHSSCGGLCCVTSIPFERGGNPLLVFPAQYPATR